jgi:iron(III) transport system substrate-binding protein
VKLEYVALDTAPLYDRVVAESATGATADVIWSSAMDLQVKLVNDGYAARYVSPETPNLPSWAIWRNEAYGTTFEPIGFVYNKSLIGVPKVPQSRAELVNLLTNDAGRFKGKVTAFDPEKSGVGYLMMTQDLDASPETFWNVAKVLGAAGLYPGTGSGAQFERLAKGESILGYNLLASYATGRIKKDLPQLGVVLPSDHTLVVSRVMFISSRAAHPNAARLWFDYLLSKRGQQILAKSDLGSLRGDVDDEMTPGALGKRLGDAVKPIAVGPGLLTHLDAAKRHDFLARWNAVVNGQR